MRVPLLVLNYNGRKLLEECLPSLVAAAAASRHACRVVVIDNSSTDDSLAYLAESWPEIEVHQQPNNSLCSYNAVLAELDEPVAVLLNNDIKLAEDGVDALVEPLLDDEAGPVCRTGPGHTVPIRSIVRRENQSTQQASPTPDPARQAGSTEYWMTSALCWRFDGVTYDGQKTAVRWRHGLVQATSMFSGHERGIRAPGWTASAGAAMAVKRQVFLELGGFDPLYLPGRLEDLDLSFRAWMAGYRALHVPTAVAYHLGMGSFSRVFDAAACDLLTLRNTLLFQWKNLRHPTHVLRQCIGLPLRLMREVLQAPFASAKTRWTLCRALLSAWQRRRQLHAHSGPGGFARDEAEFFTRFAPSRMASEAVDCAARPLRSNVGESCQPKRDTESNAVPSTRAAYSSVLSRDN